MRAALAVFVLGLAAQPAGSSVDGKWRGVFHTMPDPRDDRNDERQFRFELTIATTKNRVTGTFRNVSAKTPLFRIVKGECRRRACCFEVAVDPAEGLDVNTWCVSAKGNTLDGWRNGGKMTKDGVGMGARFFRIAGRRVQP